MILGLIIMVRNLIHVNPKYAHIKRLSHDMISIHLHHRLDREEKMKHAYYSGSISSFLVKTEDHILGQLIVADEHQTEDQQKNAWRAEIQILKDLLMPFTDRESAFELSIPRIVRYIS